MSSFLSNKFLQYRNWQGQAHTIDHDFFCTACGYNVRGLVYGRNCPECGTQIQRAGAQNKDPLLSGEWHERQLVRTGLALIAACLFFASFARLSLFFVLFATPAMVIARIYIGVGLFVSLLWIIGTWLVTPRRFDSQYMKWRWLRRTARWSALLLIPGYICWLLAATTMSGSNAEDALRFWSILCRGLAGVGALFLAAWLVRLAADAELDDAARRLYHAIWMLPIPSLLLAIVPNQIPWIFVILIMLPLLAWCWYVITMALGVWSMFNHVHWAMRIAAEYPHRLNRMAETRGELDTEARKNIRPVQPSISKDLPLNAPRTTPN
jgi:hypothetical protein